MEVKTPVQDSCPGVLLLNSGVLASSFTPTYDSCPVNLLGRTPGQEFKRDFAGGPKFQKMTMQDNMSSYYISMGKVLNEEGFDEKSFYPRT